MEGRPGGRFAELLAEPGVEEELHLGSRFGFMAFHGGSLEVGTDQIAVAAARAAGASVYVVRQPPQLRWHLPSREFDPAVSPALRARSSTTSRSRSRCTATAAPVAGPRSWPGARNRSLAARVAGAIEAHLPDYEVVHDLDAIPVELRGQNPANPVNRPPGGGVQLELPPRVRGNGPFWNDHPSRAEGRLTPHTEALIDTLAEVASGWPAPG